MPEPAPNLRPYGSAYTPALRLGLWFGDPPGEQVRARARAKLAAGCGGGPVGAAVKASVVRTAIAFAIVGGTVLGSLWLPRILFALPLAVAFALALAGYSLWVLAVSRPATPTRALAEFLRCVQNREWARAHALVAPADRDTTARMAPCAHEEHLGPDRMSTFIDRDSLARYWSRTVTLEDGSRLRLRARPGDAEVYPREDLCVVQMQLSRVKTAMLVRDKWQAGGKLMIRCGVEWRLFSGELWGPEEAGLDWLDTNA